MVWCLAAAMLLNTGTALAQGQEAGSITISVENSKRPEIADVIAASLTDAAGSPVGNVAVEYWIATDVFGPRFAFVGEALTDTSGLARLPFEPHREVYEVRVTFGGDDAVDSAEAIALLRFRPERVVELIDHDPTQLGSLRYSMPRLMGVVVGMIWAALLGLAWWTLTRIRAAAPDSDAGVEETT